MSIAKNGVQCVFSWVPKVDIKVPYNAFEAAKNVYIVRTNENGVTSVGKAFDACESAFATYNSQEKLFSKFDYLCYTALKGLSKGYKWLNVENGELPRGVRNLVIAGHDADIRPIYIARTFMENEVNVGKLLHGEKYARFPYFGQERTRQEFDLLAFANHD